MIVPVTPLRYFLSLILFLACMSAQAQDGIRQGYFLIATPKQDNTPFAHTVIYLTQAGDDGSYGLIVNRPTGITMEEVIPEAASTRHAKDELFIGGPMHGRFLFLLTRSGPAEGMHQVSPDVFFAAGRDTIIRLAEEQPNTVMRMYAGFTSWGPGQLEQEITSGYWVIAPAKTQQVFGDQPGQLWRTLYSLWKGSWI